jgi:hypothetical protein
VGSKSLSSMEVDGEGEELEDNGPLSIVPLAVSVGKEPSSSVS